VKSKLMKKLSLHFPMVVVSFIMIAPLLYLFLTSFKSQADIFNPDAILIPTTFHPENYISAFQQAPFHRYLLNSLFVALAVTISNIFLCSLAGYSLAKFQYRGRELFFGFILATMVIPSTVLIVPLYIIVRQMGWLNSYYGLIIPFSASAFGIFMMRQFMLGVPNEYLDAARIDGCGELHIYYKIVLPLSKPALSFLAVYTFITNWNSFFWPLVVISSEELKTLPLGIVGFQTTYYTLYHYIMVMTVVASLPPLILFIFTQKHYTQMMVAGLKR